MSAIGPKRTCTSAPHMSGFGVKQTFLQNYFTLNPLAVVTLPAFNEAAK